MKEFIDKLIERLEEGIFSKDERLEYNTKTQEHLISQNKGIRYAIKIVNELAEEYFKENYFNLDKSTLHDCPKCGAKATHRVNRKGAWGCGCFKCNTFKSSYDHLKAIQLWEDYCREYNIGWIPFTQREITEEEKEEMGTDFDYILDCKLPENDTEILICSVNGLVFTDTFFNDGDGCYLDSGYDFIEDAIAWQPLPAPCKEVV